MHSRFRAKSVTLTALAALLALLVLPGALLAKPKPGTPGRGFRLMARATGAMTVNRIYCGLSSTGEICVDSLGSSTIGGGFWPKGSPQQYVFNSGLQVAGAVDPAAVTATFPWDDTTGAFFFDPKGTTQHGEQVQPIYNSLNRADLASWPAAANVPRGDAEADLYDPNLQADLLGNSRSTASQGDIWTVAWDGNPGLNAGRPHPLGIAVVTRGMAWNYPTFNDDIIYFTYTFYNVTSADPNDYLSIRPGVREIMQELGTRFQTLNNAAFGITIPANGYTIKNFYANFAADMDVSSASGSNYSSVNLPFSLGYVYEDTFRPTDGNFRLPPDLGGGGFINGYGFVGVKYLKSPVVDPDGAGPLPPAEVGIRLFSNTVNGGAFGDPPNAQALFRYLSGTVSPALGDGNCNYSPITDRICYIKSDGHADMRFFQSSGPFDLAPGEFGTIVVGYVFASAVASPGCPAVSCASVLAGDANRLSNAGQLASAAGANLIDSMTGFRGYTDSHDALGNPGADGIVQQDEFKTVKGSLLAKALVAQTVFDNKFLLPAAPAAPEFFVVPGDNQVTLVWRPSDAESGAGDFFYSGASLPGTPATPNLLYDPNYRQYDVEGYRVYRGRVDNPSTLTLLAQFDYSDRPFDDYLGVIQPTPDCAPELGNEAGCPVNFSNPAPGNAYTVSQSYDIVSPFVQVKLGNRTLLATGDAIILNADTAVTGAQSGGAELTNSGVPFVYTDASAKNNLRYFYTVTAFDVNSVQSGPTSLESARVTKAVTPIHAASNYRPVATFTVGVRGRGVIKDPTAPLPTLDRITGQFSGPMPAADGASLGLVGSFVQEIVNGSGGFFARLDSLSMGQVDLSGCCGGGGPGVMAHYYYTVSNGTSSTQLDLPVLQDLGAAQEVTGLFDGITVDNSFGALYGGGNNFSLLAAVKPSIQPLGFAGGSGLAAALGEPGFTGPDFSAAGTSGFRYDGFRWFDGANESTANPTSGNCGAGTSACAVTNLTNFNNAGKVTGATLVYQPRGYLMFNREWRNMEAVMSSARRAADVRVYWGAAGVVDSVIDLTHNVRLRWDSAGLSAGWAILNQANTTAVGSYDGRPGTLTPLDWTCVQPFKTYIAGGAGFFPCAAGTNYAVSKTAVLGPVAVGVGNNQSTTATGSVLNTANNNGGNGFSMYVAGTITFFGGMPALPAANTSWTLRTYSGAVFGGGGGCATCNSGNLGPYQFISAPRPMTAVGAELVFNYTVNQVVTQSSAADLRRVHTVPDPYYVSNAYERSTSGKVIKFVNLPTKAIVRIYSTSGVLVRVLEHNSSTFSGSLDWDVRNRNNQVVASGVYFYHIEAPSGERRDGRMTIVNFAQ